MGSLTITERVVPARTVQKVHIDEIEARQGILKGKGKPRPEEPIQELTPATIVHDGTLRRAYPPGLHGREMAGC